MDSYSFANTAGFFKVARTTRETFAGIYLYRRNKEGQEVLLQECSVTGAEILRLAEDTKRLREEGDQIRGDYITCARERLLAREERDKFAETVGHLEADRNLISAHLTTAEEERDALKLANEEAQEIIGELSAELAVQAGESLEPCGPAAPELKPAGLITKARDGEAPGHYAIGPLRETKDAARRDLDRFLGRGCPGHLGPKAAAAVENALAAWRTLEKQVRGLEADLVIARTRVEQAERRAEDAERGAEAVLEADDAIRSERETDVRLGREFCAILQEHAEKNGVRIGEAYPDTLRRIIRERDLLTRELVALLEVRRAPGESVVDALRRIFRECEGFARENREKCLELAEKAGEIRELREQLEAAKRDQQALGMLRLAISQLPFEEAIQEAAKERERSGKLLALLASEEPPARLEAAVAESAGSAYSSAHSYYRVIAQAAWRWLRDEAGSPPLSGDDLS